MRLNGPALVFCLLATLPTFSQASLQLGGSTPIYIIDSVRMSTEDMLKVDANTVALLTVISAQDAVAQFGDSANGGVVYVETIGFIKRRYWEYFKSKKTQSKLVRKIDDYRELNFILNDKPLADIDIGNLHKVNDATLASFRVIKRNEVRKRYGITGKKYGVVITAHIEK